MAQASQYDARSTRRKNWDNWKLSLPSRNARKTSQPRNADQACPETKDAVRRPRGLAIGSLKNDHHSSSYSTKIVFTIGRYGDRVAWTIYYRLGDTNGAWSAPKRQDAVTHA